MWSARPIFSGINCYHVNLRHAELLIDILSRTEVIKPDMGFICCEAPCITNLTAGAQLQIKLPTYMQLQLQLTTDPPVTCNY